MIIPHRKRGRQSKAAIEEYERDLMSFCNEIIQINSTLDFNVSSRGWCYVLEDHGLLKSRFDNAQTLINDCRKSGRLPLDICKEDEARTFSNVEAIDQPELSILFQATPIKFSGRLIQVMGRVLRPASNKNSAKIYDYVDNHVGVLKASVEARQRVYG